MAQRSILTPPATSGDSDRLMTSPCSARPVLPSSRPPESLLQQTSMRARSSGRSLEPALHPRMPGTSHPSAQIPAPFSTFRPRVATSVPPTPFGVTRGRRRARFGNRFSRPGARAIYPCTLSIPRTPNGSSPRIPPGGVPPTMVITVDGGTNWNPLPALDAQMNWGGAFVMRTQRGPSRFTGFNGYPQPTLAAFSPADPNLIIAAGIDSGVFVTTDAGATWEVVSDPFNPTASGTPHIPRPKFAHFDHLADGPDGSKVDIYVGTRGRGVFRIRLAYGPRDKAGGGAGPRPETARGAGPSRRSDWETTRTKT